MLPLQLKYQNKLESAYSRSYSTNIMPQNGSGSIDAGYGAGQTIIINIPTAQNLVMAPSESYLIFNMRVKNSAGAGAVFARLDKSGASGCIQRLRVYHASNLLEDLDNYGLLVAQLGVLQQSSAMNGKMSILAAFTNDKFYK
jgi:hypothetical protein